MTNNFKTGQRVKYIPRHAQGDENHKDCETGTVSFTNDYVVFVKYDGDYHSMLQYAEGKSILNSETEREGLVVRSIDSSFSFKCISNKYLIKHENRK